MTTRICVRCRAQTEPAVLESAAGEAAPLALQLRRMPVLACRAGHHQFVRPQFASELIEHLMAADDVALVDFEPFRVELTVPVYRCKKCSREQLHSLKEVRSRTPEALAQAFRAAGIPPA